MKADVEINQEQCDRALQEYLLSLESLNLKGFVYMPTVKNYKIVQSRTEKRPDLAVLNDGNESW